MIMCIQNLVLIGLFVFKILSKNSILTSIKGSYSVANLPKFELIQAFMHVLDTCKNEEDPIKNEGARVLTRFLPLLVYGDYSDAEGQLTPQSLVQSGRISNSSKMLRMSSLPASMKNIQSKMKALEWTQHNTAIFQTHKGR